MTCKASSVVHQRSIGSMDMPQGLDAHRGAEKERIIFETAFRSVRADRPDPSGVASGSRPDRATLHVPARTVAARAHHASAPTQQMKDLRRCAVRLPQPRRGMREGLVRPLSALTHPFARSL